MKCPRCASMKTHVVDSRSVEDGALRRRRYKCDECGFRYSTLEQYRDKAVSCDE